MNFEILNKIKKLFLFLVLFYTNSLFASISCTEIFINELQSQINISQLVDKIANSNNFLALDSDNWDFKIINLNKDLVRYQAINVTSNNKIIHCHPV
jgi:hypothetical protein